MSTSLFYHGCGAFKHTHLKTEYDGGKIYFHAERRDRPQKCLGCQQRTQLNIHGWQSYELKNLPLGNRPRFLVLHLRIFECQSCSHRFQEPRQVAPPRKSYTKRFENLVWTLSQEMTLSGVARYLDVGWDFVEGIVKCRLGRLAARRT
jgi:transposase